MTSDGGVAGRDGVGAGAGDGGGGAVCTRRSRGGGR